MFSPPTVISSVIATVASGWPWRLVRMYMLCGEVRVRTKHVQEVKQRTPEPETTTTKKPNTI